MYVVICKDGEKWCLATRKVFGPEEGAQFATSIHPARRARLLSVREFLLLCPPAMELRDDWKGGREA